MTDRLIGRTVDKNKVVCELYEPSDREVEVFVDGIQGLQAKGPVVKFNLHREIPNLGARKDEKIEKRVVAVRVVMGIDSFINTVDWLYERANELRGKVQIVTNINQEKSKH